MASRHRPPPPPLRLSRSPLRTRASSTSTTVDNQLLYDLPSASSFSSSQDRELGSVVPASPSGRSASSSRIHPANRASRALSPPSRSPKGRVSPSPGTADEDDLENFAEKCRSWYFDQDEEAGRQMTQILARLQPLARANYARIQAEIRSSYHAFVAARRKAEFHALINATAPGGSLPPHFRSDRTCSAAKAERFARFDQFVKSWCNSSMPGTRPFFESLRACMRLQVIPKNLGGAGNKRLCWEFDDAVFMESAGKEFMIEALDILKGVLGFEEIASSRPSSDPNTEDTRPSAQHSRPHSAPLETLFASNTPQKTVKTSLRPHTNRARAPSDPFLDTSTLPSSRVTESSTSDSKDEGGGLNGPQTSISQLDSLLLRTGRANPTSTPSLISDSNEPHQYLRVWTMPDLSNPEFLCLLAVFPAFLTHRSLPRFRVQPVRKRSADLDLEEGGNSPNDCEVLPIGTGTVWIGAQDRRGTWQGSWWDRFKAWLRSVFS